MKMKECNKGNKISSAYDEKLDRKDSNITGWRWYILLGRSEKDKKNSPSFITRMT